MSTIFLSHSSRDWNATQEMIGRLATRGYRSIFLDYDPERGIPTGAEWERDIYLNLKRCRAVIVLCSSQSMASPWCFVEIALAKGLGKLVFPVIVDGCSLIELLKPIQAADLRKERETGYATLWHHLELAGLDPRDDFDWDPKRPPYPGFSAFEKEDAGVYFGRDAQIDEVLDSLRLMRQYKQRRLAVVVGSSGCGKSSLVRAGVVPRLSKDNHTVVVPVFRPGTQPINRLVHALVEAFAEHQVTKNTCDLTAMLTPVDPCPASAVRAGKALADIAAELAAVAKRREAVVLLVIDQFEESLLDSARRNGGDAAKVDVSAPRDFLRVLNHGLNAGGGSLLTLATMRPEFIGIWQKHPERTDFETIWLDTLPVEHFAQVIEGPAARAGIELDPGLTQRMVTESKNEDALPLLAFTLRQMYQRCQATSRFTMALYEGEIHGLDGAVDRAIKDIEVAVGATAETEEHLQRCFFRMVDSDGRGNLMRQPALWDQLPISVYPLLEKLIDARLLTSTGEGSERRIEVTHDSLFRLWPKLQNWLGKSRNREFLLWRKRFRFELGDYIRDRRKQWFFLKGARLVEAQQWLASHREVLEPEEIDFIVMSARHRKGVLAGLAGAFTIVLVMLGWLTAYSLYQRGIALSEKEEAIRLGGVATAHQLAAQSETAMLEGHAARSLILAAEAIHATKDVSREPVPAAEQSLRNALSKIGGRALCGHQGTIASVAVSNGGRWVVTGSHDQTGRLWDLHAKNPAGSAKILGGHANWILAVAISADSHWAVTCSTDQTARLWDLSAKDPAGSAAVLRGHKDAVCAVAVSNDSRWLVTGSWDATARLWDLHAPDPEASAIVLGGHEDSLSAVAISEDSHCVITGSRDGTAKVWDLRAKDPAKSSITLSGHKDAVLAVAISSENRWIITGSVDMDARLWDLRDGEHAVAKVLSGHERSVVSVAVSPDSRWIVTGSKDKTARLWDLHASDIRASAIVLRGHEDEVSKVVVSADSRWLVTASTDRTIRVWDLRAQDPANSGIILRGHEDSVGAVAVSMDSRWVVTGSKDMTARLWDLNARDSPSSPIVLSGHENSLTALAVSSDGRWAFTGSRDTTARMWDLESKDPLAFAVALPGHKHSISALVVSADSHWMATGSRDGTARVWDLRAKEPAKSSKVLSGHEGPVLAVAMSNDGCWVATGSQDKTARLWDLHAKDIAASAVVLRGHDNWVSRVAITPNSRWLVTASDDKTARVWDLHDPAAPAVVLNGHKDIVSALAVSPNSRWVVTGSNRETAARLWDLHANDIPASAIVLSGHLKPIESVAVSGDNRWVVTASDDRTAQLWDLQARDVTDSVTILRGHEGLVTTAAVSADGRWLVTGSSDKTARLWNLHTKNPAASAIVLRGHEDPVTAVTVSADGRWVVTGNGGKARLWHVQLGDLIETAQNAAGRNLTLTEWLQYFPGHPYRQTFKELP